MRFQDPSQCTCESCGQESSIRVSELLRLTATCPNCQASFRKLGLSMRKLSDETATFFDAVQIIMQIEEDEGIEIPDKVVEENKPWKRLTINDLIFATGRCMPGARADQSEAEEAVVTAVRKVFPSSPDPLDFDAQLPKALEPNRDYGSTYD